jgi:hypothetical protein
MWCLTGEPKPQTLYFCEANNEKELPYFQWSVNLLQGAMLCETWTRLALYGPSCKFHSRGSFEIVFFILACMLLSKIQVLDLYS